MSKKKPDFIIIGAMKCATTSLHNQLALQKGFFMSDPKEPNFFSNDEIYAKGDDWYINLFQEADVGEICGESSTHYTKLPTYPKTINRMEKMLPKNTRFIYIMRNPIDRLVSQYIHEWSEGNISENINDAIGKYPQLIAYSKYAHQLRPYIDIWGKDNIHIVFFENIIANPQEELIKICTFLEYTDKPIWYKTNAGYSNISKERMKKSKTRDFISNFLGAKWVKNNLVHNLLMEKIKDIWRMKERPILNGETLDFITTEVDNDLADLKELLSISITCASWNNTVRKYISSD